MLDHLTSAIQMILFQRNRPSFKSRNLIDGTSMPQQEERDQLAVTSWERPFYLVRPDRLCDAS